MNTSYSPEDDGERATCIDAIARIRDLQSLKPVIATLIEDEIAPAASAYETARTDNDGAALQVAKAIDEKNEADKAFERAFDLWLYSVYAAHGEQRVLREIKPLLGNVRPSRFLAQSVRTRLERMPRLDLHARGQPHLTGDLAKLDALKVATAALEKVVPAWEAALDRQAQTSKDRRSATRAFDRAWRLFARSVRQLDPEGAGPLLPTFHRQPRRTAPASVPDAPNAEPEATEPEASAESEPEVAEPEATGSSC